MADHEDHAKGTRKNQGNEEQSTFGFPIMNLEMTAQMKNILPLTLPHFHAKVNEDPNSFMFEFDILCRIFYYSTQA